MELQAISRVHRQGNKGEVTYIRLEGKDCTIDDHIITVGKSKTAINEDLMRPLIRRHDEGPANIALLDFPRDTPMDFEEEDQLIESGESGESGEDGNNSSGDGDVDGDSDAENNNSDAECS